MREVAVVVRADVATRVHRLVTAGTERPARCHDLANLDRHRSDLGEVHAAHERGRVVFVRLYVMYEDRHQIAIFIEADHQPSYLQLPCGGGDWTNRTGPRRVHP